jgi:hypothetical protein
VIPIPTTENSPFQTVLKLAISFIHGIFKDRGCSMGANISRLDFIILSWTVTDGGMSAVYHPGCVLKTIADAVVLTLYQ